MPLAGRILGDLLATPFICAQSHRVAGLGTVARYGKAMALQVPKNVAMMACWYAVLPGRPAETLLLCTALSHLAYYPFMTVIRRYAIAGAGQPLIPFMRAQTNLLKGFSAYAFAQLSVTMLAMSFNRGPF
jgi:hypothetical protein